MKSAFLSGTQVNFLLDDLFRGYAGPNFAVRLWDHSRWQLSDRDDPACTFIFRNRDVLRSLLFDPSEVGLGEAFIRNDLDVEGDLFSAFDAVDHVLRGPAGLDRSRLQRLTNLPAKVRHWFEAAGRHTRARDRAAIAYHYDQPVEFFRLWLGKTMAYSCAYFPSGKESLDEAQINKLDLISRKLRLQPLERILDVGCGWGGLVLHAAAHYGVYAHGITLSQQQAATAGDRIRARNMTQSCVVELKDYRAISVPVPFDKIASIGMFEHVGRANLPQYFAIVYKLLKPGGVFLNHGIAAAAHFHQSEETSFINRYVFPEGELVTLHEGLAAAEKAGFEVRDVENLREHYEKTLRLWVTNLEKNADLALRYVSETTYRIWRLYMAGCAVAFHRGDIAVYQTLLSRPAAGQSRLPPTRDDWYRSASPA